jgi:hypothetical protein
MSIPLTRILGSLFLLTSLTACSQSANDETVKELQTAASWAATVHMAAAAWLQGDIPKPYAQQTLQKAQQELQKEANTLGEAAHPQPQVLRQLKQIGQITEQISAAIGQDDRATIGHQIQQLEIQQQQLSRLTKAAGGQL